MSHLIVNGEYVEEALILAESETIKRRLVDEKPNTTSLEIELQAREWGRENAIERVLLRQAAARSPGISAEVDPDTRLQLFLAGLTKDVPRPTRTEIGAFYKQNQRLFLTPESVHASHIVKNVDEQTSEGKALAAMQSAREQLAHGWTFEAVADKWSDCPGSGGSLGWFSRGEMVEEFDAVVFRLRPGEISEIFRSPFGFHLVKLHERKPAGVRPLPDVFAAIEQQLHAQKNQAAIEAFLDDLRAKADIRKMTANPRAL